MAQNKNRSATRKFPLWGGQCRPSAVHLFQGERNTDLGIAWPLKLGRLVHFTFLPADGEGVSTRHGHVFRKFGDMEIGVSPRPIHVSHDACAGAPPTHMFKPINLRQEFRGFSLVVGGRIQPCPAI